MKTRITTAALTIMFLSAGAFAGSGNDVPAVTTAPAKQVNITVIEKNADWPPAGQITVDSCRINRCFDI